MTEITLDFLGRQIQRVLDEQRGIRDEQASLRDEIIVFGGRIDALAAIVKQNIDETRHVGRQLQRVGERVRRLEDRVDALEDAGRG